MALQGQVGYEMTLTAGGVTIGKARDVDLDMSATEVDVTTRDSGGWKKFRQGLKEWGASANQLWVPTNAGLVILRAAFFDGSLLAVTFVDENGHGFSGSAIVSGLTKGEPLDDAATLDVTLKGDGALTVVAGTS